MRPLRGLQETRVATREESGVLGVPSRRPKGMPGDSDVGTGAPLDSGMLDVESFTHPKVPEVSCAPAAKTIDVDSAGEQSSSLSITEDTAPSRGADTFPEDDREAGAGSTVTQSVPSQVMGNQEPRASSPGYKDPSLPDSCLGGCPSSFLLLLGWRLCPSAKVKCSIKSS